jgi:hypothetical protein
VRTWPPPVDLANLAARVISLAGVCSLKAGGRSAAICSMIMGFKWAS